MVDSASKRTIVVVGDLVIDHNLYEGDRSHPAMLHRRGVRLIEKQGGAAGIHEVISLLAAKAGVTDLAIRLHTGATTTPDNAIHHAFATFRPFPRDRNDPTLVWRAELFGYGEPGPHSAQVTPGASESEAPETTCTDVLVVDDAGHGFRMASRKDSWLLTEAGDGPRWVVLKMSDPVARGDLWGELSARHKDRLVCLVSADDLRRGQATINRGLSWERTIDDIRMALASDPVLSGLRACRHLVVTLSRDGALWIDDPSDANARAVLIFDPAGAEGAWDVGREGQLTGYLTTMVSSLAFHVARAPSSMKLDLSPAIQAGLLAMRDLSATGHGRVEPAAGERAVEPVGYPASRMADAIGATSVAVMASVTIPWGNAAADERWMIVESAQIPAGSHSTPSLLGPARLIVNRGPAYVLRGYPNASFGKLAVVDRQEIEALRGIRSMMRDYRSDRTATKPLSIGVFGPPGAGKSFGVRQLSNEVFGERAWMEFNLSQFDNPTELMGPFHQVRDLVLAGITPVVFWDEFDSRENEWLQYLLAPMQDGRFQDGPLNHAIGKSVFVFAGGTSPTYAMYAPSTEDEDYKDFRLRKGPDFVSRLDAFYDVVGPNPRRIYVRADKVVVPGEYDKDASYPLRRALLTRNVLAKGGTGAIEIDSDLLNAILLTREYRHGSRSLEKLLLALRPDDGGPIRRSALPPHSRLAMHVDPEDFLAILNRNTEYRIGSSIETQASKIHAAYREHLRARGETIDERLDREYSELATADMEDNRAAARRTVDVLALIGMGVAPEGDEDAVDAATLSELVEHHIERLAEAEHEGWMTQRRVNGWKWGTEKNVDQRRHPSIKPYAELRETDKEKDRLMVRDYERRISESGFCIVWLASGARNGSPS